MRLNIKHLFLAISSIFVVTNCFSQTIVPVFGKQKIINGFNKEISGQSLQYFSVYQDVAKEALLTRCTDGNMAIEWFTDSIPKDITGKYAYFSWIAAHSSGTSSGTRKFDLYINDKFALTLTTLEKDYSKIISASAADSTQLIFDFQTKDRAYDSHGFCYLRVPISRIEKGKCLKLKLVGQNQKSNDWMMTFKYSFKESISFEILPFILKKSGKQVVQINVMHFGKDETLTVQIANYLPVQFMVHNGFNSLETEIIPFKEKSIISITGNIGKDFKFSKEVEFNPAHYREINLIHHSHTDIGYSDYQENVVKIHTNNIFQAMHLIEKTKDYPVESRFKWNIEAMWDVENFMEVANAEEKARFFSYIKSGDIALNGFYINALTGLCSPEELDWLFEYGNQLKKENGTEIKSVMFCDIPGLNWGIVNAMAKQKIRYFLNGPNYSGGAPDFGDRIGSTIRKFGDKPFWWVSHTGKDSILFWTGFKGYSAFHQLSIGAIHLRGEKMIAENMLRMDNSNYPYEMVIWNYNIVSDNGPTDSTICDFVKNWNEKYSSPKLQLTTAGEVLSRFEQKYGSSIPSLKGDFSPYWEDGAYSTAAEEAKTRELSNKLTQLENYAMQTKQQIDSRLLYRAHRSIIMFHEHTWGSWSSISDPESEFSVRQWNYKKRFLDSAEYYVNKINKTFFPKVEITSYQNFEVINTLNYSRSGYVEMFIPEYFDFNTLKDSDGKIIAFQKLSMNKILIKTSEIAANSSKKYSFSKELKPIKTQTPKFNPIFIDQEQGIGGKYFLNPKDSTQTISFQNITNAIYTKGIDPTNTFLSNIQSISQIEDGPLMRKYLVRVSIQGSKDLEYEVSQYAGSDELKVYIIINKEKVAEKEAMHFLLDFDIKNPELKYGINDTCVNPKDGLLSASNLEFFSVQRWIDISNDTMGVTICSPQMALFEAGQLVDEEKDSLGRRIWRESYTPSSKLYIYALNNYWHTNYKADQEGIIKFDVYLKFHQKFSIEESNRFGLEKQQPLIITPIQSDLGCPSF